MGKATIAKLSRPRLHRAVARPRLHLRLDELRDNGCVWVSGPPGSGKTTLVASWIQSRNLPCMWYRVDSGDTDPATLFSFLVSSLAGARRRGKPLPYLSTDYRGDPANFARRFMREYFLRLAPGTVVVFDNFHEAAGPDLNAVFRAAIGEIPEGITVVVISRQQLPPEFSSHLLNRAIALVEWNDLRFDADEVAALVGDHTGLSSDRIGALIQASDGWVAGLTLMLARAAAGWSVSTPLETGSRELLFGYFAEEILDRAPRPEQDILMRTALLPQITPAAAVRLTGDGNSAAVLETLFHNQYFVDRHVEPQLSYRYHDLFRQFLLDRASRTYASVEWNSLRRTAAELLLDNAEADAAVELLGSIGAWERLRSVIAMQAGSLMRQGRWQTLLSWTGQLPEHEIASDPWMLYWQGVARAVTDIRQGRAMLEQAAIAFEQTGDDAGIILTASTVVDSYFQEWDTVAELDPWLDRLLRILNQSAVPGAIEIHAHAEASLMIGLLHRRPGHPQLRGFAERMIARVGHEPDPGERLRQCTFLLLYFDLMGDFARAFECFGPALSLIQDAGVAPRLRMWALSWQIRHHAACADFKSALACSTAALELSRQTGVVIAPAFMYVQHAQALLEDGRGVEAWEWIEKARPLLSRRYEMEAVFFHWLELWTMVVLKDYPRAQRMWDAFTTHPTVGVPFNTAYNLPAIFLLAERGDSASALTRVVRWRSTLCDMASPWLLYNLDLMEAYAYLRAGDEHAADGALGRAFDAAAAHGFHSTLAWVPEMMSPLLARALRMNIQPEFVARLVRLRGLRPPADAVRWPWPVKIFTLGRFLVLRHDTPITFAHRPQHRTLALLKAIVAAGASGIAATELTAHLWPDADGDAARNAFHVALSRLRRLLGDNDAVLLEAGRVRLHDEICWVDAFAFDKSASDLLSSTTGQFDASPDQSEFTALYRGYFLGDDPEVPWALSCRDRLHAKFIRVVLSVGGALEQHGHGTAAADLYRRALEVDNLQEELYRRLMRCLVALGETAEALTVYRRCRDLLSIVLGVAPSAETEMMLHSLRAAPLSNGGEISRP